MPNVQSEIEILLERRIEACRSKDIDKLMSIFAAEVVYFDVVPPLRFVGHDAVRDNFLRWFAEYDGPIRLATREATIAVEGDVAFAHMLHEDLGTGIGQMARDSGCARHPVCAGRTWAGASYTSISRYRSTSGQDRSSWIFSHEPAPDHGVSDKCCEFDSFGRNPVVSKSVTKHANDCSVSEPEDVAVGIAFLASEDASFVIGANMTVDGGVFRIKRPASLTTRFPPMASDYGPSFSTGV